MSRRLVLALAALAFLVAATAVVRWALKPAPPPPVPAEELVVQPPPPQAPAPAVPGPFDDAALGGTFAGVVVNAADRPVAGADVLLVATSEDAKVIVERTDADGHTDTLELPELGGYRTAARTRTDEAGRFSLAAGSSVRVVALVAWEREYAPGLRAHTTDVPLRPGPAHRLVLRPAGWLKGRTVDAVTGAPVARVEATVYFQHRANQGGAAGPERLTPSNAFGVFQTYVAEELGPLVWGVHPLPGDTGFTLRTSDDGWFTFGPVMSEVQVEVILTHPDYMWTDPDPEQVFASDVAAGGRAGAARRVRLVVPPGETKEVTYRLEKGKEIAGRIVDADGRPIDGVRVALEHVAQYAQHHRYRTHARAARTDRDGRFRVAGLSYGPYNLRFDHPTFETEWFSGVKEGSNETYKVSSAGGWVALAVDGGPKDEQGAAKSWSGRVVLEPLGKAAASLRREEPVLVVEGKATVERVRPGRYAVTVVSGTQISSPAVVEVQSGAEAAAAVRMQAGAGLRVVIRDAGGRPVDPAQVELWLEGEKPEDRRRAAGLVAREGVAVSGGLLPGRYSAVVSALGYVPTDVAPFEVAAGRETSLPPVTLRRQAYLKIVGITGDDGRPVAADTELTVTEEGGEPRRRHTQQAGLLPVRPGSVILKATTADGRHGEHQLDVADGATVPVEVRVSR